MSLLDRHPNDAGKLAANSYARADYPEAIPPGQGSYTRRSGGLHHVLMQSIRKLYKWLMSYDRCWVDVDGTWSGKSLIDTTYLGSNGC